MAPKIRLNANSRLLHRFYEPLVLLRILRPSAPSTASSSSALDDAQDWQARFLDQLAWLCDYDRGGKTVSSIAAEHHPNGPIYWLAKPGEASNKARDHLQSILIKLRAAYDAGTSDLQRLEAEINAQCTAFSHKKVKNYRHQLAKLVGICADGLNGDEDRLDNALLEKLKLLAHPDMQDIDLCHMAFDLRYSGELERLSLRDALHRGTSVWADIRHYIGRLGSWLRASKALVHIAATQPHLVDGFTIRQLSLGPPVAAPEADAHTNLEAALKRMLPAGSSDLPNITASLQSFRIIDVASKFLEEYKDPTFKPRVHAEAGMLEHFYQNKLTHCNNYRYIGCSKRSCYCCDLYIRNHPGNYIQRPCHGNVWKNWQPPVSSLENGKGEMNQHTKTMLNAMNTKLRSDVIFAIMTTTSSARRVPDSSTGLSLPAAGPANDVWEPSEPRGFVKQTVRASKNQPIRGEAEGEYGDKLRQEDSAELHDNTPTEDAMPSGNIKLTLGGADIVKEVEDAESDEEVIVFMGRANI